MKARFLFSLAVLFYSGALAQQDLLPVYSHTISYPDHKTVFQLQETDQKMGSIDPGKKYYWYSANQIKVTQGGFSGRLLNGTYTDFYPRGNLKEKGRFDMGLKQGEWSYWAENGILVSKLNYKDGEPSGRFFRYNALGTVIEQGNYRNGLLDGRLTKAVGKDSLQVFTYAKGVLKTTGERSFWSRIPLLNKKKAN